MSESDREVHEVREVISAEAEQKNEPSTGLVTLSEPDGVPAEAYRTLRTNLFYALIDEPPRVIAVTSPGPGEGKSVTCANLGVVLAQAGKDTLILDCDLRKPTMHKNFGLRSMRGMVDVLIDGRPLPEVWHEPVANLKVLPVGIVPPNPSELLESRRFSELLRRMRDEFDYVLVDAPPVGLVSDPLILATRADGVLLVVNAQKTRKATVRRSMRSLEAVEAKVLGTVLNNVNSSRGGYAQYQSYTYA